ncbi:MAG: hypothetical protein D4R69_03145 [Actinomycetales bacterium]|nr:MAG: hypothetical protein D4R69_03145 [Actinomycetales bacterium]
MRTWDTLAFGYIAVDKLKWNKKFRGTISIEQLLQKMLPLFQTLEFTYLLPHLKFRRHLLLSLRTFTLVQKIF